MLSIINDAFRILLINLAQLAIGCIFTFAVCRMASRGFKLNINGKWCRLAAVMASSLAGILLPLGPFGIIPVFAACCMAGLELPLVLPMIVSGLLFNMSMPLTQAVFVWHGNIVMSGVAFVSGFLAGLLLMRSGADAQSLLRKSVWEYFFALRGDNASYIAILRGYIETAGLFILAGAVLNAALSSDFAYWIQKQFFSTGIGLDSAMSIARLNAFSPFFRAGIQLLTRLLDFTALASLLFLLRFNSLLKLYLYYIVLAVLLSVSLFIK